MFSGPVGAYAYKAAAAAGPYDAVFLVGPSHFVAFEGVSVWPAGAFDSPLGSAPRSTRRSRRDRCSLADRPATALPHTPRTFARDAVAVPSPAAARRADRADAHGIPDARDDRGAARTRSRAAGAGRRALLVASTDLSHYFDAATALRPRRRVQERVERASIRTGCWTLFEQYPEGERGRFVACGGGPAIAVMLAARARGARHGRVLKYVHSGEISGDNSGVVGYLAGALGTFTRCSLRPQQRALVDDRARGRARHA